jgi:chaperonin GroEL
VAYLRAIPSVRAVKAKGDEKIGVEIVAKALEGCIRQIVDNCGMDGAVVASEVMERELNYGYDAREGKYCDLVKAGIIDPAKVVRSALQNAASIAGLMLTTQVLVTRTDALDGGDRAKVEGSVR